MTTSLPLAIPLVGVLYLAWRLFRPYFLTSNIYNLPGPQSDSWWAGMWKYVPPYGVNSFTPFNVNREPLYALWKPEWPQIPSAGRGNIWVHICGQLILRGIFSRSYCLGRSCCTDLPRITVSRDAYSLFMILWPFVTSSSKTKSSSRNG